MARGVGGHSPANVAHHLKGIDFPADKNDLVNHAKNDGADNEVMEVLDQMPTRQYGSMADVMKGVGEVE